jgi:glyoxylase-like metal-dependent hydrolase (beta-lactamase superfamily II)
MRHVVSDVYVMEGLRGANVYALVSDQGLTLVDSGMAGDVVNIVAQIQGAGHSPSEIRSIVLTHWHGDHVGGAAELVRRSGAQVVAHRDEVPYIEQSQPVPSASLVQRLLNAFGNQLLLRRPACRVDRPVDDGDIIDALRGTQVVHAPGHSPGSLCLYQPDRQILFCGDALFGAHPITGKPGLGLHMRLLTLDNGLARESVRNLSALPVEVLCCGHGEPIVEGAADKMRELLSDEKA